MEPIANMVALSRGRIKLDLKPTPEFQDDSIVSIERAKEFRNWLNS